MATNLENLKTRRQAITDELAALDATLAGGLPNVNTHEAIDHQQYKMNLYAELEKINQLIEAMEGGWEHISEVTT